MAAAEFFLPFRPALDANGIVVAGAKLYFYATETTTPQTIYADAGLTTPLTNPVEANAAGVWPSIYLDDSLTYRVYMVDAEDDELDDQDPYIPGSVGGPPGTLTNNSGVVTTVPAGGSSEKVGHSIVGGGGAFGADKGIVIDMDSGTLSGIDIIGSGTGANMRFFRPDGLEETYISDGNALITAKWIGIYAGLSTVSGSIGAENYNVVYHPPCQIGHMFGVHADVNLSQVYRGANVAAPFNALYMKHDGYGYRLDMADGSVRFARLDDKPFIGDVSGAGGTAMTEADFITNYATNFPMALEAFNAGGAYGYQLRSYDIGTIGEMNLGLRSNGAICGATTGRNVIQYESGTNIRIGNSTDATTINAISQTVFEIAGANVAYIVAGGFHPLTDDAKDLGTTALSWRALYLTDGLYVDDVRVVKEQGAAVADATDAASAITQLNALLARCRSHGLIAT